MKPKDMLTELEKTAQALGVNVSYESIASSLMKGGLCRVKGQYRVIIDKRLTPDERIATLAESIAGFAWAEISPMHESVRSVLRYYSARRNAVAMAS